MKTSVATDDLSLRGVMGRPATASPLVLCDRLLTLAEDVDRAGFRTVAEHLLELADAVLQPAWQLPMEHAQRHA